MFYLRGVKEAFLFLLGSACSLSTIPYSVFRQSGVGQDSSHCEFHISSVFPTDQTILKSIFVRAEQSKNTPGMLTLYARKRAVTFPAGVGVVVRNKSPQ